MKISAFIIFLSIVLTVYFSLNYYIYIRGLQALPQDSSLRTGYKILFLILSLSFVISRFIERFFINKVSEISIWTGNIWLGAILYLFLFIVLLDTLRIVNHFFHIFPAAVTLNYAKAKLIAFITVVSATSLILIISYINAINPLIRRLSIEVSKDGGNRKELNIALASDIHLGTMIKNSRTERLVDGINSLNPDIILLAGDIVDEDLASVIAYDLGESIRKLKAPLGVYAITGNHEYIGGADKSVEYIEKFGIKYLRDESLLIDSSFFLVGREDRDKKRFSGKERKELKELLSGLDHERPLIVMNHQPFKLLEAAELGVDLHLSGHTHHGQMWPLNFITKLVYEVSMGYKKIKDSHFYVSSGYGTWGPPMRLGNRPEIVYINVKFKSKK